MKRFICSQKIFDYLHEFNLLEHFSKELINNMELFIYQKGELICKKHTELTHIFFLVRGKLKTYNLYDNGKSLLLKFNYPLSVFGDVELFSHHKVHCSVEAMCKSTLIAIEVSKVRKIAGTDYKFLRLILQNVCDKLHGTSSSASLNLLYSLKTRIASYLLSMSNSCQSNELVFTIPKSIELAQLLGTSYRHLNRTLKELITSNIICKDNKQITILDLNKLTELAKGNIYET
ncbi:Crp/Fnr family transcriptional regulator [Clostridium sp. 'deep sea']|uniref:Crp/Fnr family transcriptional regulator n=1 Tax=Clostridium sp. 'deep sea' TaxID=2779445 RepID=UPI00189664F6|nr:Crp/Fnr family transcriptional regulator [Clostridium sp. 'deep sea']QOR34997.1 Crp/Fnr family transcriptional regulator [Clostridium sp. 'deep sea']